MPNKTEHYLDRKTVQKKKEKENKVVVVVVVVVVITLKFFFFFLLQLKKRECLRSQHPQPSSLDVSLLQPLPLPLHHPLLPLVCSGRVQRIIFSFRFNLHKKSNSKNEAKALSSEQRRTRKMNTCLNRRRTLEGKAVCWIAIILCSRRNLQS